MTGVVMYEKTLFYPRGLFPGKSPFSRGVTVTLFSRILFLCILTVQQEEIRSRKELQKSAGIKSILRGPLGVFRKFRIRGDHDRPSPATDPIGSAAAGMRDFHGVDREISD